MKGSRLSPFCDAMRLKGLRVGLKDLLRMGWLTVFPLSDIGPDLDLGTKDEPSHVRTIQVMQYLVISEPWAPDWFRRE